MDKLERSIDEMVAEYREAGIDKMVLLGWDAETATGLPRLPNEYVSSLVDQHPDMFIGFAGVDPHKGVEAVKELQRAVQDLGLRGLKLHPIVQKFFPNDERFYPSGQRPRSSRSPSSSTRAWPRGALHCRAGTDSN